MKNVIPEEELKYIKKILIVQYKPFGDILLNTGYLPFLRKKFPDTQIDFLIQQPYVTLLEDNPHLDNLVIMQKKKKCSYYVERIRIIKEVRKQKYDLIIDQLRSSGSAQIVLMSGAKYKIGWNLKRFNWVYNYRRNRTNDRYYSLMKFHLLEPLEIHEQDHNTYYKIKDKSQSKIDNWLKEINLDKMKFIVFSPGTPVIFKQWSLKYYAELADMIQQKTDLKVVLLWGPGEKVDCIEISKNMQTKPIYAIPTTFNEAAALLRRAKMYISQDGGINHVSVAVQTPSIALFGHHTNPKKWQAWHKPEYLYLKNYDHKDKNDRTLGITPEEVYSKFEELMEIIK